MESMWLASETDSITVHQMNLAKYLGRQGKINTMTCTKKNDFVCRWNVYKKHMLYFNGKQSGYETIDGFFFQLNFSTKKNVTNKCTCMIPTIQPIQSAVKTKTVMKRERERKNPTRISFRIFLLLHKMFRIIDRIQAVHTMMNEKLFGFYCLFSMNMKSY